MPRRLLALLLLAGCASQQAERGEHLLVGQTTLAALTCLGLPAGERQLGEGRELMMWTHASGGTPLNLPFADLAMVPAVSLPASLAGTVSLNGSADCRATALIQDGTIASVVFAGDSGGLSGPNAACRPIVRGCLQSIGTSK